MNKYETQNVIDLVKMLANHPKFGWERATICAVDCMLQDQRGLLKETISAWITDIQDVYQNRARNSTLRHGAWVPSIPV